MPPIIGKDRLIISCVVWFDAWSRKLFLCALAVCVWLFAGFWITERESFTSATFYPKHNNEKEKIVQLKPRLSSQWHGKKLPERQSVCASPFPCWSQINVNIKMEFTLPFRWKIEISYKDNDGLAHSPQWWMWWWCDGFPSSTCGCLDKRQSAIFRGICFTRDTLLTLLQKSFSQSCKKNNFKNAWNGWWVSPVYLLRRIIALLFEHVSS